MNSNLTRRHPGPSDIFANSVSTVILASLPEGVEKSAASRTMRVLDIRGPRSPASSGKSGEYGILLLSMDVNHGSEMDFDGTLDGSISRVFASLH